MAKGKYEEWLLDYNLILLEGWARDGLTDEQIAYNMGIHIATLCAWKNKYPEINEALKKGKAVADYMVENALFKSALGYDVEEWEEKLDSDGEVRKHYKKRHIPPSNTAQIFWLKNRVPEKWRDKPVEITADDKEKHNKLIAAIKGMNEND